MNEFEKNVDLGQNNFFNSLKTLNQQQNTEDFDKIYEEIMGVFLKKEIIYEPFKEMRNSLTKIQNKSQKQQMSLEELNSIIDILDTEENYQ